MISNKLNEKCNNYRYCIVKKCKNTSMKTPDKLWIKVPSEINMRKTWLKLAKRDPTTLLTTNTQIYFCEDHFDLENDIANHNQYKILGSVKRVRIRTGCIPSKFKCQIKKKHKSTLCLNEPQQILKKRAKVPVWEDNKVCPVGTSTSSFKQDSINTANVTSYSSLKNMSYIKAAQVVQHNALFNGQAVQAQQVNQHASCCVVQQSIGSNNKPSVSGQLISNRKYFFSTEKKYDSEVSYTLSQAGSTLSIKTI